MQPECVEALCQSRSEKHVFVDIFHRLACFQAIPKPFNVLRSMGNSAAALLISNGVLASSQFCAKHNQFCQVPSYSLEFTGTPCQDYSRIGARDGLFTGQRFPVFWCWAYTMLSTQPAVVIHENVVGFPENVLRTLFSNYYSIHSLSVDCSHQGFDFVSRPRLYIVMFHRVKTVLLRCPVKTYSFICSAVRHANIACSSISACFLADVQELAEEIAELAHERRVPLEAALTNFYLLLSTGEKERLSGYIDQYLMEFRSHPSFDSDCIFNLSDNPHARRSWSAASRRLPCFRTNGGKLWSCFFGRWLTNRELLASMGVPVYEHLARQAGVPAVAVRPGAQAAKMIGNLFHVASAGSVLLAALSSASLVQTDASSEGS